MSKASKHDGLPNEKLAKIAARLRLRMRQLNLSETELARRCDCLAHEIFDDGERPNLTRERIAKILMNAQTRVGKGAARIVSQTEIVILAEVLDVAPEWLASQTAGASHTFWDIAFEPKFAGQVMHLLAHYEEETGETLLWGESLLCSLTPPEFAHAYHENYFAEFDQIGLREHKRNLVETYDRVGNERRERLFGGLQKRNFAVTQIVFLSEMEKIPRGEGNYKNIKVNIRRKCLENLSNILTNRANRVSLIVARDEDAPQIKHILRDYDRFSVNGEQFSMWSYHSGKVAWSENENIVRQHRQILEELKENSSFREPQAVLDLLSRLRETAEE